MYSSIFEGFPLPFLAADFSPLVLAFQPFAEVVGLAILFVASSIAGLLCIAWTAFLVLCAVRGVEPSQVVFFMRQIRAERELESEFEADFLRREKRRARRAYYEKRSRRGL